MSVVVHALLICSEDRCSEVYEAYGPLPEIEALACDCGCGLEIVGWPDAVENGRTAVELELVAA